MVVETTYDILNCGPNNCFVANGKLVHNSGGDKQNAQNMPRVNPKDPDSGVLRRSLNAPPGHKVVVRDLGQIEARMLAYIAGQEDLLDVFRQGKDPYNRQASLIFGKEIDRKSDEHWLEGLVGKSSTLGNGYGMGWGKFQEGLRVGFMGAPGVLFTADKALLLGADVDQFCLQKSYKKEYSTLREEALAMKPLNVSELDHLWHCAAVKTIVDRYRASNHAIVALWKEAGYALAHIVNGVEMPLGKGGLLTTCAEGIRLVNGMKIRYHGLKCNKKGEYSYLSNKKKNEWSYIYGGKVVENVTQGLSRIVLSDQLLQVEDWMKGQRRAPEHTYQIVSSTHDELICVVPERRAEECQNKMAQIMATPPEWCKDLPLKSSGGYADNYGDCDK